MGTNFYWLDTPEDDEDGWRSYEGHIGKRSAAGRYCWDCRVTLCKGGETGIHSGQHGFYAQCPRCLQKPTPNDALTVGAAAVELGFAATNTDTRGVGSASSFTWAADPIRVRQRCIDAADVELVRDEYGRRYTGRAFLNMLRDSCPIEKYAIGVHFS